MRPETTGGGGGEERERERERERLHYISKAIASTQMTFYSCIFD